MLKFYFSYRGGLERLRSGALGAEMDRIAGDLHSQGYKPASAKLYLSRIARFSHFANKRCGSEPIGTTIVDRYLLTLGAGSPRIAAVTALQHARREGRLGDRPARPGVDVLSAFEGDSSR